VSSRLQQRGLHVGRLLVAAERRFNDDLLAALHASGLDDLRPAHGAVFANVDPDGTRPSELARRAGMTKQAMGELIADLEAKGYVERRPDPADGRAALLVPTDRGRAADRAADDAIARIEAEYVELLGRDRFDELVALLLEVAPETPSPANPKAHGT
jgi:DNA-binding MarR family transcriptional regulator